MSSLTLLRSGSPLADPSEQTRLLDDDPRTPSFQGVMADAGYTAITSKGVHVLQVNVGRVCNQTCAHCHVDAGPDRRESMSLDVSDACIDLLKRADIHTLDITGGAPEMNPYFRRLVTQARQLGCDVIDRCNLTILLASGYTDLPEFLAENRVEIVASLPCYLEANVDAQRGEHAFRRSIEALTRLNDIGYGIPGSPLTLTLVHNPLGPKLPPLQVNLESAYRVELRKRFGIEFTRLYTITNMPISRFLADLVDQGKYSEYMQLLVRSFNPHTVDRLMCRSMLSVDWKGDLFDCDFNQMLNLSVTSPTPMNVLHLSQSDIARIQSRQIVTGKHCFGCTAGGGSSCSGDLR